MDEISQRISQTGVVPISRLEHPRRDAAPLARALCAGGIPVAEVTFRAPGADEAIRRMRRALEELVIEGYPTNAALAHLIMHDPEFVRGQYDTSFLDRNLEKLLELARTCDHLMDG